MYQLLGSTNFVQLVDIRIAHIPPIATHRPNMRQPHQISEQTRNPTRKTCAYHLTSSFKSATEPPKLASTTPVGAAYAQPGCAYAPKKDEYTHLIHRKADRAGCRYCGGAHWRCGYRSPSSWKSRAPTVPGCAAG